MQAGEQHYRKGSGVSGRCRADHEPAVGLGSQRADRALECLRHGPAVWLREGCSALLCLGQPHLKHWVQLWVPQRDIELLVSKGGL